MHDVGIESVLARNGGNGRTGLSARMEHLRSELSTMLAPGRSLDHSVYCVRIIHVDTMPSASLGLKMTWLVAYA